MKTLFVLLALSILAYAAPGDLKWRLAIDGDVGAAIAIGRDGTVYFHIAHGAWNSYLYAVSAFGELKWTYPLEISDLRPMQNEYFSSPAIGSDGTIYVGSLDGCLVAMHPSGDLSWRYQTGDVIASSPAIGPDGTIYLGSDDSCLYAINPSGTLKWRYKTGDMVWSSPAIGHDGTVYVGSADGYLYSINPSGTLNWKYQTEDGIYHSSPAIDADGTIYVGSHDHYLYAMNPSGELKWRYQTRGSIDNSPVIGSDGTIYAGTGSDFSYFYALNPDGSLKWNFEAYISTTPAIGFDGILYFGSLEGFLYAINPDSTLKWRYGTFGMGSICSSPAIAHSGTVYVALLGWLPNYLYAIESSSQGLADSPWPKFHHDNQNTGRASGGGAVAEQPSETPGLSLNASLISGRIRVSFTLPEGQSGVLRAVLRVYNVTGRRVAERAVASSGQVEFSQEFPKGVYFVRLDAGAQTLVRKAVVIE